jgi:NitT/TauT family transport system ATP-binding protein
MTTTSQGTSGDRHTRAETLLEVKGLRKVYDGRVEAVRDLTFAVGRGEFVCIVGPSGAGKTTLLKCIAGLLPPTSGTIVLEGDHVSGPRMTVRQNVELPLKQKRIEKARRRELVGEALAAVSLADVPDAYPWQLSGGMQQRVAIARAVAYEPHILLMDEPFAAVDAQTRADLEDLMRSLWHRMNVTTVFVTHDIDEAVYLGQRVLVLSSAPTVVLDDVTVDLPVERDQLTTRSSPRFAELRAHVFEQVRRAKQEGVAQQGRGGQPEPGAPPRAQQERDR